ncbi:hypothetical protein Tco_1567962, partial [Tanacetum coccineum]
TARPKVVNTARPKAVNTARPKAVNTTRPHSAVVNTVSVNQANAIKALACWGKPLIDDKGFVDSACLRHMIGNIAYLSDFKEFDGGYVTFGGGAHGDRISMTMLEQLKIGSLLLELNMWLLLVAVDKYSGFKINCWIIDLLTKGFDAGRFQYLVSSIGMLNP